VTESSENQPQGDPIEDLLPAGAVLATRLADGEWHRLHPATPLLRGGIVLIVIAGYILNSAREQLIGLVVGGPHHGGSDDGDPVTFLSTDGRLPLALLGIFVVLAIIVGIFYLSWRVHEFRITDEVVEVRSGLIRRIQRKGRLDRIQGINIVRPFFARLFGAARLEIDVAGHDANVRLDYLSSSNADGLRRDILRLASGTREREAVEAKDPRGFLEQRAAEFIAPELDPNAAPPESVVKVHIGRLIGSVLLHDTTFTLIVLIVIAVVASAITGHAFAIFFLVPFVFSLGGFVVRRFTKSLRYSIASTPDGVRIGFGLLTLSNETLPPGRIHSIQVRQPILWRLPGWWEIRVNRASKSNAKGADGQRNSMILPVGNLDDVLRVLALLIPSVDESATPALRAGIIGRGTAEGFVNSPGRAAVVRLLSWYRNGFLTRDGIFLLREGAFWRKLTIVPEARVQSIAISQGPINRALRLVRLHVHTVNGPIRAELDALDRNVAIALFGDVSLEVVHAVTSDATHRWREDAPKPATGAA
jgi:putative membrane protein